VAEKDPPHVLSIEGREVRITHPDKPYFAAQARLSKLDVVQYYLAVADGALHGIREPPDRAEALRRRGRGRGVLPEARAREAPRPGCAPSRSRFHRAGRPRRSSSTTRRGSRGS
jgi:hypothetical protein